MNRSEDPKVSGYLWRGVVDEYYAITTLLRREWRIVSAILLAAILLISFLQPVPSSTIRMAGGQPNSGLDIIAQKYKAYLAPFGIDVEIIPSGGAPDNLAMVSRGEVDIGLSQTGLPSMPDVQYLGSMAYQPLWLFYRGQPPETRDLADFLAGKIVSVGIPGSGTKLLADLLLDKIGDNAKQKIDRIEINSADTLARLRNGTLDAAFLLANYESKNTQELLARDDIGVYDFAFTHGLSHTTKFLEPVMLPAAAVSYHPAKPASDIHMVATTVMLVAHKNLHRATQLLLLSANKQIAQGNDDPFTRTPDFPAFVDRSLPRSPAAVRFYEQGAPILFGRVSYWVASIFDSLWVYALTFFAILYPLLRVMPSYRRLIFSSLASSRARIVRQIESRVERARLERHGELQKLQACLQDTHALKDSIRAMWIPNSVSSQHLSLLASVIQLEDSIHRRMSELGHDQSAAA